MRVHSVFIVALTLLLVSSGVFVAGAGTGQADETQPEDPEELYEEGYEDGIEDGQQLAQAQSPLPAHGEPDLRLHAPNPIVQPGETNEVPLVVTNDGELERGTDDVRDAVTTARSVEIDANADDTPLTVKSGTLAIGPVPESQPNDAAQLAVDVPDDVDAGTYTIDVDISYSYTWRSTSGSSVYERSTTDRTSIDVTVDDDARFEIVDVSTDAQIGDTGTLTTAIKNVGNETATDVNVALESMSSSLLFGSLEHETTTPQDTAMVNELEPNETATVRYDVSVMPDTSERYYMIDGTVSFKTADGLQRADDSPSAGVAPMAEQQFSIGDVRSDLHVGEDGDLRGVLTNDGPSKAANVVVHFTEESPTIIPIEPSIAVGSLEPGESASFTLPLDVSSEAEPIDRVLDLAVQYRTSDFEQRMDDDLEVVTAVSEQRDAFTLDVLDREITAGDEKHVDVEVTNNLDEAVTDIEANLFASDPLDSDDDEAFVESLEPGETASITFELEADAGATEKTYPISFDFRYDDASGTSQLSDTTRVAIDVLEGGAGLPVGLIVTLTLLGTGAGAYVYQRR
ncbi:COG1361 S-layer family protein [Natronobacterium gregoryi]|uniref:Exo-alpha-sialidase n=2 Tax=Natronobacterium gregoryi TaxID=44930 RepID=L0AN66_NATGS|nr:COG1361 S-layer family protein [Natronobacterium gregoryi]AFZ74919.1 S-layer domain-containing protein [Natronobacterium gregoryi SP2]PLK19847.1 exo-alpha-sialidase [Natronobacterium gregoryi SP2]SFJ39118.1 conserved repeat domain-containing protein [Natronobacterium gregoryi]